MLAAEEPHVEPVTRALGARLAAGQLHLVDAGIPLLRRSEGPPGSATPPPRCDGASTVPVYLAISSSFLSRGQQIAAVSGTPRRCRGARTPARAVLGPRPSRASSGGGARARLAVLPEARRSPARASAGVPSQTIVSAPWRASRSSGRITRRKRGSEVAEAGRVDPAGMHRVEGDRDRPASRSAQARLRDDLGALGVRVEARRRRRARSSS